MRVAEKRRVAHDVEHIVMRYTPALDKKVSPESVSFFYAVVIFKGQRRFFRSNC